MDFFEILILLFFIVIPLLQQVLGRRGRGGEPDLEESGAEGGEAAERATRPQPDTGAGGPSRGEWSTDWGEWPTEDTAPEPQVWETEDLVIEHVPEAVRVRSPVVSLEQLRVDRKAEHARIHKIHARDEPPARSRQPRVKDLIRSRDDLRRAIILAEVLGKPAGLRDFPGS